MLLHSKLRSKFIQFKNLPLACSASKECVLECIQKWEEMCTFPSRLDNTTVPSDERVPHHPRCQKASSNKPWQRNNNRRRVFKRGAALILTTAAAAGQQRPARCMFAPISNASGRVQERLLNPIGRVRTRPDASLRMRSASLRTRDADCFFSRSSLCAFVRTWPEASLCVMRRDANVGRVWMRPDVSKRQ